MKKISKNKKLIILISIITIVVIIGIIVGANAVKVVIANREYNSANNNSSSSNLIPEYIKDGVTLGGVTGTLIDLDTSDATAEAEDIFWGKTAYVKGQKITGTRVDTVAQGKEYQKVFEKNTTLKDDYGNLVTVPTGFKISQDSATAAENGIVIEDKDGNQFVWIPAKTGTGLTIKLANGGTAKMVYQRTNFGMQLGNYTDYSESMPSDEETSVNKNGGYYIGRYESGDKESTVSKTMRGEGASQSNTLTIKKNQVPYNLISVPNAKNLAENMDTVQGYKNAITKLVSSYAWDTALNFIQIKNNDYATNSEEGNYIDIKFNYIDINGNNLTKNQDSFDIIPTGQTTPVSNIYDMGGNLYEFTSENNSSSSGPYVNRGGVCHTKSNAYPAGFRNASSGGAISNDGFRVTLFLQ